MGIILKNVTKTYGEGDVKTTALDGVSIEIDDGAFVVVLGPSGSGKSTLLNVMSGLDTLDEGEITIDGARIDTMKDNALTAFRRKHVGFVFQQYNLLHTLTAKENVDIGGRLVDEPHDSERLLDDVGLAKHKTKYPFQLSGGEQQRVSIARALAKRPKVLFCDEPTGALDEEMGKAVLGILQRLNEKHGTTVVLITHNAAIARLAHIIVRLNSGKVVSVKANRPVSAEDISWGE